MPTIQLNFLSRTFSPAARLLTWTPIDGATWVIDDLAGMALHRLDANGFAVVAIGAKTMGLEGLSPCTGFSGPDGALWIVAVEADDKPGVVFRFDGTRFERLNVIGNAVGFGDAFCADPTTGRFFHIERASGRVSELTGGTFVERGTLQRGEHQLRNVAAVWDRARGAIVAAVETEGASGSRVTIVFDDGRATVIAGVPGMLPSSKDFDFAVCLVNEPRTGRAMLVRRSPTGTSSDRGFPAAAMYVFGTESWQEMEVDPPPHAFGYVSRGNDVLALGPGRVPHPVDVHTSNTAVRREWGLFDGKRWTLHGRVLPIAHGVASASGVTFVNLGDAAVARLERTGNLVEPIQLERLRALAPTPTGLLVPTTEGVYAIATATSVFTADATMTAGECAWVWHDGLGALLAIGGKDNGSGDAGTSTFAFRDGHWSELMTRGKPFAQYRGVAGYHAGRGIAVLAGGIAKTFVHATAEFDGKTWTTFHEPLPWDSTVQAKRLAFDAESGHLFAIVAKTDLGNRADAALHRGLELYRYAGAGAWKKGGDLVFATPGTDFYLAAARADFSAGFDPRSRRVICTGIAADGSGVCGVLAADVGPLLDSWSTERRLRSGHGVRVDMHGG